MRVVLYLSFALIWSDELLVYSLATKQLSKSVSGTSANLVDKIFGKNDSPCSVLMSFAGRFAETRDDILLATEEDGVRPNLRHHLEYELNPDPSADEEKQRQLCHKGCLKRFGYVANKNGHAAAIMEGEITWRLRSWYYRCYCKPTESFASLLQGESLAVWRFELIRKVSLERALKYLKDNGGIDHVSYNEIGKLITDEFKRKMAENDGSETDPYQ